MVEVSVGFWMCTKGAAQRPQRNEHAHSGCGIPVSSGRETNSKARMQGVSQRVQLTSRAFRGKSKNLSRQLQNESQV